MERFYPEKHKKLSSGFSDKLPYTTRNPFHPHSGVSINCNARTTGHFDPNDALDSCTTGSFGEFTGGELVYWQLGLIVKPRKLEALDFFSRLLFHFNLDYFGFRGSIVFHTEKEGQRKWCSNDNNGWSHVIMK
jgi:hypothetical protein